VNVLRTNGATAMPAAKMRNPVEPGPADIPSVDRLLNARAFQRRSSRRCAPTSIVCATPRSKVHWPAPASPMR